MSDEHLKQRIAYLVEHGGMYEDPLTALRKDVRLNRVIACFALCLALVFLVLHVTR